MMTSTLVRVRFPNSMYLCHAWVWLEVGVTEPGTHSGQLGQPSPEEVNRTMAPVMTMPVWAIRFASNTRDFHAEFTLPA